MVAFSSHTRIMGEDSTNRLHFLKVETSWLVPLSFIQSTVAREDYGGRLDESTALFESGDQLASATFIL